MNLSKGWGSRIESVHPYGYIIEDKLKLYVSRDSKLHEKVFVLKAKDGFEEGYRISTIVIHIDYRIE